MTESKQWAVGQTVYGLFDRGYPCCESLGQGVVYNPTQVVSGVIRTITSQEYGDPRMYHITGDSIIHD
ncbi:MAG: hypothetical protein WC471_03100 [Candidatus Woesearchaeota archaeon]